MAERAAANVQSSETASGDAVPRALVDDFRFSSDPSLESLRQLQDNFVKERNWQQYHTPRNVLLALVGEVGEVAELFQWKGEVPTGLPDWTPEERTDLAHELSDVLIYLVRLAQLCSIDLPRAALEKIALNAVKYPKEKVYGSSKKYYEYKNDDSSALAANDALRSQTVVSATNGNAKPEAAVSSPAGTGIQANGGHETAR